MKFAVVAFGGNAIMKADGMSTYEEQAENAENICEELPELLRLGYEFIITHGNGPQVGNFLIQQERMADSVAPMPLDVCNAMTQGQIGYMIEQGLRNVFVRRNIDKFAITFLTRVIVSAEDRAFKDPTKFIGPFFNEQESKRLQNERGWQMKEDSGRGWRRVVPSPTPIDIVEKEEIADMVRKKFVVVAGGGGGIPVVKDKNGELKGISAVIDKDLVAGMLASFIGAEVLFLITQVEHVALNFGTPEQKKIERMTVEEASGYFDEGHFPPGSMGPKVEAAIKFINSGGKRTVITSLKGMASAMKGEGGTEIVP